MKTRYLMFFLMLNVTVFSQNLIAELPENENDTVKKKVFLLNEVVITTPKNNLSISRGNIAPIDLPQALQVIDKSIIQEQQAVRLSDVVKNINGAYVSSARGGAQESFWSRGYDLSSKNIFKNGFRINSGSLPEVSSLEQIEFLKGNAALLFGNVAPGGILNLVTKNPKFEFGGEVSFQAGSYNFYKPTIDIYGPLNNAIAYRVNASYENSKSFRDVVQRERYYINPSFLFKISAKTEILLHADYLHDLWTPDFGTAMVGKEILDMPRNTYIGALWSNGKTTQTGITMQLKYSLGYNWKLSINSSFQDYDRTWEGTERIQPNANGLWNRPLGEAKNTEQQLGQQATISGIFYTGSLKHQFTSGLDWENSFTEAYTFKFTPATYGSGNVYDFGNFNQGSGIIPDSEITKIIKTETNLFGALAQDLISFPKYFKLLLGLRWSFQEAEAKNYTPTATTYTEEIDPKRIDKAFSPKIGIVFQPINDLSFFASYSNSFTPNTGTTIDLKPIKSSILTQYEAGIKKEFAKGKINSGITIYKILNDNLAQTAQFDANGNINTNTNIKTLRGETKSTGIEIDLAVKATKSLNILAGYSYNDMRFTKTTITQGSYVEGDRLTRTPYSTANFSAFYKFQQKGLNGFKIGATASYTGERLGGWNNDYQVDSTTGQVSIRDRVVPLSDYTTVDLSLGYEKSRFSILAKISNVTNELNYTVHENYSVNPIAPRQLLANINYKF
jgi:iron complex outermembrane receptor protein